MLRAQGEVGRLAAAERIEMLDVLRGLAILCILFMNIPGMAGYVRQNYDDPRLFGWTRADQWAFGGTWMIDGTMRGLLQLLFGAGMMISLRHSMTPDGPVGPLDAFLRRNLWLIAFGAFNALVLGWWGDILLLYGLTALFLPAFRLVAPRRLFAAAASVMLLAEIAMGAGAYVGRAEMADAYAAARAKQAAHQRLTDADRDAIAAGTKALDKRRFPPRGAIAKDIAEQTAARRGGFAENWRTNFDIWTSVQFNSGDLVLEMTESFGTMIIGAALYGWRVVQGKRSTRFYLRLLIACYGFGLVARGWSLAEYMQFPVTIAPSVARTIAFTLEQIARLPIAVGHIALVALLLRSAAGARLVRPLVANGKLPLSTYFTASAVTMLVLFPGYGFDLWGRFGAAGNAAIAVGIIAVQIVAANLWLRAGYSTGPFEWLWKTLAYGRRQPWRRAEAGVGAGAGWMAAE